MFDAVSRVERIIVCKHQSYSYRISQMIVPSVTEYEFVPKLGTVYLVNAISNFLLICRYFKFNFISVFFRKRTTRTRKNRRFVTRSPRACWRCQTCRDRQYTRTATAQAVASTRWANRIWVSARAVRGEVMVTLWIIWTATLEKPSNKIDW